MNMFEHYAMAVHCSNDYSGISITDLMFYF